MYESHWKLKARPFEPNADKPFYYPAESHQGALLKLRYAVENRREAAMLAGGSGTGKTLLTRILAEQLADVYQPFVRLVFPQMSPQDLLAYLADSLGAPSDQPSRHTVEESLRRIEVTLSENARQGRHAVIAIDEAHLLWEQGSLETLRLLLNIGGDTQPLTLLLVGQPNLLTTVQRMPSLEERLAVKTLIRPLNSDETASYISHRLKAAGAQEDIFDATALDEIYALTHGFPRAVNRLCDLALLVGYAQGKEALTAEEIAAVSEELVTVSPE